SHREVLVQRRRAAARNHSSLRSVQAAVLLAGALRPIGRSGHGRPDRGRGSRPVPGAAGQSRPGGPALDRLVSRDRLSGLSSPTSTGRAARLGVTRSRRAGSAAFRMIAKKTRTMQHRSYPPLRPSGGDRQRGPVPRVRGTESPLSKLRGAPVYGKLGAGRVGAAGWTLSDDDEENADAAA